MTALGLDTLRTWVAGEMEPQPVRDLETLRLWSIWLVDPDEARALVRQALQRHTETLTAYETELAELVDHPRAKDRSDPWFASRLTLQGGVLTRRAAVQWCEWMLAELDETPATTSR